MKLEDFHIELRDGVDVLHPGEEIHGTVVVQLKEAMKLNTLRLSLLGRTHVHWADTERSLNSQSTAIPYTTNEVYCEGHVTLYGKKDEEEEGAEEHHSLHAGRHQFPFRFQLPKQCPPSFEGGTYGHIRYQLKCEIEKPWKFNHTTKTLFSVLGLQDLNDTKQARRPASAKGTKKIGAMGVFSCISKGEISAQVSLPKTGYVPGEYVPVEVEIVNETSTTTKRMEAKLMQKVTFSGMRFGGGGGLIKTRTEVHTIKTVEKAHNIPPNETFKWTDVTLQVPSLPQSNLGSKGIQLEYFIRFDLIPSGLSKHLHVDVPVLVGAVPLKEDFIASPSKRALLDRKLSQPKMVRQDSFFGRRSTAEEGDTEHMRGDKDFAPKYTFFVEDPEEHEEKEKEKEKEKKKEKEREREKEKENENGKENEKEEKQ